MLLERSLILVALAACGGSRHAPASAGPTPTPNPNPTPTPNPNPNPNPTPNPSPGPGPTATVTASPVPTANAPAPAPVTAPVPAAPDAGARAQRPTFAVLHALRGIDVVESVNHVRHIYADQTGKVDHASINVLVTDGRVHTVAVNRIELLRGHCRTPTWESRTQLQVTGYTVDDWDSVDPIATGTASVALPAKSDLYAVSVGFAGVGAYQGCDRFAFAITLVIDGTSVAIEAPLHVKRYDPRQP